MGAFFKSRNNDILIYINFKSLFLKLVCILYLLLYSYKHSLQKNRGKQIFLRLKQTIFNIYNDKAKAVYFNIIYTNTKILLKSYIFPVYIYYPFFSVIGREIFCKFIYKRIISMLHFIYYFFFIKWQH